MEELIALANAGKYEEFLAKLSEFNTSNATAFTFVDRFGETTKQNFIDLLLKELKNPQSNCLSTPEGKSAVLTAIRLCLREPIAVGAIDQKENVLLIVGYTGLESTPTNEPIEVQEEACKCLVNLVAKNKSIERMFVGELGGPQKVIALLQKRVDKKLIFPLCRVIFHVSLTAETAKELVVAGAIELMINLLDDHITDNLASLEGTPSAIVVSDAFKVIFNLTLSLGPLSGSGYRTTDVPDEELLRIFPLVPIFTRVLVQPSTSEYVHSVKLTIVNCMINTPKGYMIALLDTDGKVLHALMDILSYQLNANEKPTEALTPILMLLTNLAEEVKEARTVLKEFVFPKELLDSVAGSITVEAPKEIQKTPVGSKLIPHMTTVDIALKHYVNEFFYMICDENANEVCRLTGFGNAAGLLVMRGLMKLGDSTSSSPKKGDPSAYSLQAQERHHTQQQSESEQPEPQHSEPQHHHTHVNQAARREGETEEEHADRLAEQLQRLVDQGIVKVVRKGDN